MRTVQRAGPELAETLTALTIAAKRYWNYPEAWIQFWLPLMTVTSQYIRENETWTAMEDGRCIAYYSLKQTEGSLWLDNLWVLPEFIGKGIGRELFRHALERSRALGAARLNIEAEPNAQAFYEKMGARKTGERHTEVDGCPRALPLMEFDFFQKG